MKRFVFATLVFATPTFAQQPSLQATIDAGTADTTAFLSQLRGQIMQDQRVEAQMKAQIDEAIKSDRMIPSEAMRLLEEYERGLKAYTYLSF